MNFVVNQDCTRTIQLCHISRHALMYIVDKTMEKLGFDGHEYLISVSDDLEHKLSCHLFTRKVFKHVIRDSALLALDFSAAFLSLFWSFAMHDDPIVQSTACYLLKPTAKCNRFSRHLIADMAVYHENRLFRFPLQSKKCGTGSVQRVYHPLTGVELHSLERLRCSVHLDCSPEHVESYQCLFRDECVDFISSATHTSVYNWIKLSSLGEHLSAMVPKTVKRRKIPLLISDQNKEKTGTRLSSNVHVYFEGCTVPVPVALTVPGQHLYCPICCAPPFQSSASATRLQRYGTDYGIHCHFCSETYFFPSVEKTEIKKLFTPDIFHENPINIRNMTIPDHRYIAIDAPTGSGKTVRMIKHISEDVKGWIIICNRIQIAEMYRTLLRTTTVPVIYYSEYRNIDFSVLKDSPHIVIVVNSLHKLNLFLDLAAIGRIPYKKLLIDEFDDCLSQLTSTYIDGKCDTRAELLLKLISFAPQCIAMQYRLGHKGLALVEQYTPHLYDSGTELVHHVNFFKIRFNDIGLFAGKTVYVIDEEQARSLRTLLCCQSGVPFYYIWNAKAEIHALKQQHPTENILFLTAESQENILESIQCDTYRGIFSTAVLQGGLTINSRYQLVVNHLTNIGTFDSSFQAQERQRVHPVIYIFVNTQTRGVPYRYSAIAPSVQDWYQGFNIQHPFMKDLALAVKHEQVRYAQDPLSAWKNFAATRNMTFVTWERSVQQLLEHVSMEIGNPHTYSFPDSLPNIQLTPDESSKFHFLRCQAHPDFRPQKRHITIDGYPTIGEAAELVQYLHSNVLPSFLTASKLELLEALHFPFDKIRAYLKGEFPLENDCLIVNLPSKLSEEHFITFASLNDAGNGALLQLRNGDIEGAFKRTLHYCKLSCLLVPSSIQFMQKHYTFHNRLDLLTPRAHEKFKGVEIEGAAIRELCEFSGWDVLRFPSSPVKRGRPSLNNTQSTQASSADVL
eukprot:GDKJ01049934.1.p1 GENE.GDKJ01049934.1~~GDKJ01049934.1.p1  ORF type:complete len:1076 (+),score=70.73 GDKJ01049934.1:349-3228(+)